MCEEESQAVQIARLEERIKALEWRQSKTGSVLLAIILWLLAVMLAAVIERSLGT